VTKNKFLSNERLVDSCCHKTFFLASLAIILLNYGS